LNKYKKYDNLVINQLPNSIDETRGYEVYDQKGIILVLEKRIINYACDGSGTKDYAITMEIWLSIYNAAYREITG